MSKKVFIGVGHGGDDPGAVANGLREKDINLQISLAMQAELIRHDVTVGISRTKDENDPLSEEIKEANAFNPDIAVEVHTNAGGGDGFEVFRQTNAYAAKSKALAEAIEKQVKLLGQNSRGVKTRLSGSVDYYGWCREVKAPAVLCECAFIDSADRFIIDELDEQKAFGIAYAKGVLEYLGIAYIPAINSTLTLICGEPELTALQMRTYLLSNNPNAPDYTDIYLDEGRKEGIRGDIAFAQSCLETGYWKFGGDVKLEQNNFCGLGATGGGEPGCKFVTVREGIRAQIQHLKAYANSEPLNGECIDPRFKYVERASTPYVEWLGIPDNPKGKGWAAGNNYGKKILDILSGINNIKPEATPDTSELDRLRAENNKLRQGIIDLDSKLEGILKEIKDLIKELSA